MNVWNLVFKHTCAHAQWAHMHCFLSVCLSVTWPKFILPEFTWPKFNYFDNSLSVCHLTKIHLTRIQTSNSTRFNKSFLRVWWQLPIAILELDQWVMSLPGVPSSTSSLAVNLCQQFTFDSSFTLFQGTLLFSSDPDHDMFIHLYLDKGIIKYTTSCGTTNMLIVDTQTLGNHGNLTMVMIRWGKIWFSRWVNPWLVSSSEGFDRIFQAEWFYSRWQLKVSS